MQLCGRRVATPDIRSEPHMLRECFDHVIKSAVDQVRDVT
jgi:hypothetical protein